MSPKSREQLWWIGVPILMGLFSVLPYWLWNIMGGVATWWRVPVVTPGLFDTYVYLHWMGAAAEGLAYGGHLKWFGYVLEALWTVIGRAASIPELWIVSRWLTFTLTVFGAALAFERWADLSRAQARVLSISFFSTVVVTLGMRPGVYAWYLPFGFMGLTCVFLAVHALKRHAWIPAVGWSVVSLGLCWLYPWFFMVAGLWIAVAWVVTLIRWNTWMFPALLAMTAVAVFAGAEWIARWVLDPAQAGLVGMYERNGMAFARVPFFANTVLAIGAWIIFLFMLARRTPDAESRKRLELLGGGWIAVLLLWFHTPFTGLHTYSDHFIGPVTVIAWISLAVVWGWSERTDARQEHIGMFRWVPMLIAAGSTLFFFYILQQPVLRNIWRFDSYVIHLAHWLALAVAAWTAVWRLRHPTALLPDRIMTAALLVSGVLIGLGGIVPAFIRDVRNVAGIQDRVPVVAWIRSEIPETERMCADPETASFFAAHTGRRVFPAEAVMSWPDSSEQVIRDLQTLVRSFDVRGAGLDETFRFLTDHYRTIPCTDESEYSHNAPYARMLATFGFTEAQVSTLIGCDTQTLNENRERMDVAIDLHATDREAFPVLCPSVIMTSAEKPYWHLPPGYVEHHITSDISVWKKLE